MDTLSVPFRANFCGYRFQKDDGSGSATRCSYDPNRPHGEATDLRSAPIPFRRRKPFSFSLRVCGLDACRLSLHANHTRRAISEVLQKSDALDRLVHDLPCFEVQVVHLKH
jgi:hypothetical protein